MHRTAACACGQLTARCQGDPIRVSVCHCLACKQRTGSAFSWNARFDRKSVVVSGEARSYARTGDEGSIITHHFCPTCGVAVHYENSDVPDMIAIPAGAFADATFPAPSVSVYHAADRRCAWLALMTDPLVIID